MVRFHVKEQIYRAAFTPQELATLEMSLSQDLAKTLGNEVGVFQFVNNAAADTLSIALGDASPDELTPVCFTINAWGKNVQRIDAPLQWVFRGADEPKFAGTPEVFRADVDAGFQKRLKQSRDDLITNILGHVVLTDTLYTLPENRKLWVLPFDIDTVRVAPRSRFEIHTRRETATTETDLFHESEVTGRTKAPCFILLLITKRDPNSGPGEKTKEVRLLQYIPAAARADSPDRLVDP